MVKFFIDKEITLSTGLRDLIRILAKHPAGVHSANPQLARWDTAQIGTQARKLVSMGQLFSAKISHREARYFSNAVDRDAFVVASNGRKPEKVWRKAHLWATGGNAPWPADAPAVETSKTIKTICPGYVPRFQEHVISFVHGGLRCA